MTEDFRYVAGTRITRREVLHGQLWLDLIVHLDASIEWKDVDHLSQMLRSGRMTGREVLKVLTAAEEVADLLRLDDRWWSRWDDWLPQHI